MRITAAMRCRRWPDRDASYWRDVESTFGAPSRIEQGFLIALAAVAEQADDAAGLASCAHRAGQLQAADEVDAGRAAVLGAEQGFELQCPGNGRGIVHFHHVIDNIEQETGFDLGPADALDPGRLTGNGIAVTRTPTVHVTAAGGLGHAQARVEPSIAQVASDGGRSTTGTDAAHDPGRYRLRFAAQLAEDRFGDVVVAAPVGGAFGQTELIEMAGTLGCMLGRTCVDL